MNPDYLCRLQITGNNDAITSLAIEKNGCLPHDHLPEAPNRLLTGCARQLHEYFSGARAQFQVPVALHGTPFQKSVWKKLAELGWGEVTQYGDIARATGRPLGGRAVGGAIRANPIPIIIPCHRVLSAGGLITGYSHGAGILTKAWLLDHEGVVHAIRTAGPPPFTTGEILGLPSPGLVENSP